VESGGQFNSAIQVKVWNKIAIKDDPTRHPPGSHLTARFSVSPNVTLHAKRRARRRQSEGIGLPAIAAKQPTKRKRESFFAFGFSATGSAPPRRIFLPFDAACPHRFAKLHEDCTRSVPPLRRERRFALQSSLMGPGVAVNREPAHSRIRTSHTRLPCVSLSLSVETVRAFGQLWAPRSHISALIPAFSCVVISVGWLLYRHGWPSVGHGCRRCKPTRNR
jgi:hypothetical protein